MFPEQALSYVSGGSCHNISTWLLYYKDSSFPASEKEGVKTRRGRAVGQSFSTKVEYNFGYMWGFYFLQQEHNEILVGIYHVHNYGIMVVKEAKRLSKWELFNE